MKKFYSLLAVVAMTAAVNAQVFSENFDTLTGAAGYTGGNTGGWSGNIATGTLTGKLAGWTTAAASGGDKCLKLGSGSSMGSATTPEIAAGPTQLKLTFRAGAWDSTNEKTTITVSVASGSATVTGGTITLTKGAFNSYTVNFTDVVGPIKIKFSADVASNNRFFLDDVVVTDVPMAVVDATKGKANLVKNTIVSNELIFGAAAKVSVFNTAGQVVKTAEVAENSRLDVSALPKGTYVVTGLVNGQAVSQKIIKK
ncbi:T9SS type A sorting domain-containing protein [Epilithonimonas hominis]|uniref:Por secretion system C-terminal sorting domain-containing protein n=1 Tax=Epilithonimonas hominis TaxID=420404 RepID=A0A1H6HRR6_9FLAO|nr:T9SS type A sorting domain-containing protein [Epilithonimonas hominis]SEH36820.1 Por secretion system C-terminal sorting domain-containing protein [Epilithonimonas hominis]